MADRQHGSVPARGCWFGVCVAALLLAAAAAGAGVPALGPAEPRVEPQTLELAGAARFRQPGSDEMLQFYAAMEREDWHRVTLAMVPTGYTDHASGLRATSFRHATLFGDVDGDGQEEWIVGCYFTGQPPMPPALMDSMPGLPGRRATGGRLHDSRARIVVFKQDTEGAWQVHWRSPGLGFEFRVPRYNMQEVRAGLADAEHLRPPLALLDVDGDGALEISYNGWSQSETLGALPGIYRFDQGRWVSVAPQADRFGVWDVNGDGNLEVVTGSRYIGHGSGDDDVPRVWRWNGRQYQDASPDFPRFYADLVARYSEHVRRLQTDGVEFDRAAWGRAIQKAASLSG